MRHCAADMLRTIATIHSSIFQDKDGDEEGDEEGEKRRRERKGREREREGEGEVKIEDTRGEREREEKERYTQFWAVKSFVCLLTGQQQHVTFTHSILLVCCVGGRILNFP